MTLIWNNLDFEIWIYFSMSYRLEKINELIRQEIGKIILENEEFAPGVLATIMSVKISEDILHANVLISCYPTKAGEKVLETLDRHIFGLQQELNKKLKMHPVPKIRFVLDKTESEAQEIEKIMEKE